MKFILIALTLWALSGSAAHALELSGEWSGATAKATIVNEFGENYNTTDCEMGISFEVSDQRLEIKRLESKLSGQLPAKSWEIQENQILENGEVVGSVHGNVVELRTEDTKGAVHLIRLEAGADNVSVLWDKFEDEHSSSTVSADAVPLTAIQ